MGSEPMSAKPMARRRGSTAVLMNSFNSGSSSSSSVCGPGPLTSGIRSSFARAREMRASSSYLMSAACMDVPRLAVVETSPCRLSTEDRGGAPEPGALLCVCPGQARPRGDAVARLPLWPLGPGSRCARPGHERPASRHLGAAEAEAPLHARPQHEHEAEGEEASGTRPQGANRVE